MRSNFKVSNNVGNLRKFRIRARRRRTALVTVPDVSVIVKAPVPKRICFLERVLATLSSFFERIDVPATHAKEIDDAVRSAREERYLKYGYNLRWFF